MDGRITVENWVENIIQVQEIIIDPVICPCAYREIMEYKYEPEANDVHT